MRQAAPRGDQQALFDVVVYLVNSAPTSLGETPSLAAFRMLDAASRLLDLIHPDGEAEEAFLRTARVEYDAHFNLVMTDQEAFQRWLPDYVRLCTEEALRRQGPDPAGLNDDVGLTPDLGPHPDIKEPQ